MLALTALVSLRQIRYHMVGTMRGADKMSEDSLHRRMGERARMFKVCHVQLLPILSGVQRAMLEIFRQIDRSRYELNVVCQGPGPLSDELRRLDVACHFVPDLRREINPWIDLRALATLTGIFRRLRFDLVHTHSSKPGVLGRIAARRAGVPCVVHHVHGSMFHAHLPFPQPWLFAQVERWAGRQCDHALFVNHEDRHKAIDAGFLKEQQCQTVYNGIDMRRFHEQPDELHRQSFRKQHGLHDDEALILFLGRLEPQKQPLLLPAIADRLRQLQPRRRWRLVVAGSGSLESSLRSELAARNLADHSIHLGWQADPASALLAADIQLQPSLYEGLPLTLIEGHAAGVPAVASNVRGNREVVAHDETGLLCAQADANEYAAQLSRLIDDGALRAQLGAAARRRAFALFDGDVNMQRVAQLYDEWLGADTALRRAAA